MQNIKGRFEKTVSGFPEKTAIRFKAENRWEDITYGNLGDRVRAVSAFLKEEGIGKDDKVAIIMENRPEWPVVFFAAVSIGAVCVPLNPGAVPEEVENIVKDSECRIVFADDNTVSMVEGGKERCPSVKKIVSVDSEVFGKIFSKPAEGTKNIDIAEDDLACILYTSGTTAVPKGVMLTHRNLISNCGSLYRTNVVTQKDNVVSILPLHHTYPLTVTMLLPILYGGRVIYPESMRPEDILEAMREAKGTVFVAVPQIFSSFHQKITEAIKKVPFPFSILFHLAVKVLYKIREKTGINLSRYFLFPVHRRFGFSMRLFASGGAKLDENVAKGLFRFGFTMLEGYGLTETAPVLTFNPLRRPKIGSVGVPIPDVEIRIANKDEKGIGEVLARGPNVMKGYYRRKDLTGEVIKDGWFHTGDLGYMDEEGYLFLTGRTKEVIVLSSGVNVYPDEVEEAYIKHSPVKEMCVFEVPFKRGGEEVQALWAIVVPDLEFFKKYGEINLRNVIKERFDNVSRVLPSHMRLMGFTITLDKIPRTLLGKIKRYEVKEIWTPKAIEEGHPAEERKLSEEDLEIMEMALARKIIDYLKKQTGVKGTITPAHLLELDLGIDSLGRIELASGLEKLLDIEIQGEIIGSAFTVKDLVMGIEPLLPEGAVYRAKKEEAQISPTRWKDTLQELPKEENLAKIDLKPGFWTWLGCFIFVACHYLFFRSFYDLKVEGKENFPKEGPYILYGNHTSYFDGLLVASALPGFPRLDLFFVGFRPYFNVPIIRNLIKIGRIIPLDFSSHLLEAMKSCFYVLKNGRNLCLFPEGIRTLDGNIGNFKKGFGILAKESGAKLVPVAIIGAYEAWPRTSKYPRRHPIKVRFGKAVDVKGIEEEGLKLGAKDSYEAICVAAREELVRLKED
jgi:long-chain acyl-CoA synthetase